ncbi:MAG TPA: hypothetical protein VJT31_19035 [Rugosimonospora sp.]|nr:hypothetical protein [Rugosimonospora sp.]
MLSAVSVVAALVAYLAVNMNGFGPRAMAPPIIPSLNPTTAAPLPSASAQPVGGGDFLPPQPQPVNPAPAGPAAPPGGSPTPGPPPGSTAPAVTLTQRDVMPVVDLTQAGTLDWMHFGRGTAGPPGTDRKRDGSGDIADAGGTGARGWYGTNPQRFRWNDGWPTGREDGTPTGVYVCGVGGGFMVTVNAGPTTRTLRLYAGLWRARGQLTVSLSSGPALATAYLENRNTNGTAEFTVTFQAPAGSQLVLRWYAIASYDRQCGNVDLQAVTLG